MVIEELISVLGFKVDNLSGLRLFERGLDGARRGAERLSRSLRVLGTTDVSLGKNAGGKLASNLKASQQSSYATAYAIGRTIRGVGLLAGTFGSLAISVGTMVAGLVAARGITATMRRDLQLGDAQTRTTPANVEKLSKGLEHFGAKEDDVRSTIGEVFKSADEAIKDPNSDAAKWFKEHKIPTLDKRGNQRDSAAVFDDIVRDYLGRHAKNLKDRAEYEANPKDAKKGEAVNSAEKKLRKERDDYPGLTGLFKFLDGIKDYRELDLARDKANRLNPSATPQEEDKARAAAERWAETSERLSGILGGLGRAADDVGDSISKQLSPSINSFLDSIVDRMKSMKLIPRTQDEFYDDKENRNARERLRVPNPDVERARKLVEGRSEGGFMGWLFGQDDVEKQITRVREAVKQYDSAKTFRNYAVENDTPFQEPRQSQLQDKYKNVLEAIKQFSSDASSTVQQAATTLEKSLNFTGKPDVDTSAIDQAQQKAEKLMTTLNGVTSAAAGATTAARGMPGRSVGPNLRKGNLPAGSGSASP